MNTSHIQKPSTKTLLDENIKKNTLQAKYTNLNRVRGLIAHVYILNSSLFLNIEVQNCVSYGFNIKILKFDKYFDFHKVDNQFCLCYF